MFSICCLCRSDDICLLYVCIELLKNIQLVQENLCVLFILYTIYILLKQKELLITFAKQLELLITFAKLKNKNRDFKRLALFSKNIFRNF